MDVVTLLESLFGVQGMEARRLQCFVWVFVSIIGTMSPTAFGQFVASNSPSIRIPVSNASVPLANRPVLGSAQHVVSSPNFRVYANDRAWAEQISQAAELQRKQLAVHWLGHELPNWSKPCPLVVTDGPTRPAEGQTNYTLDQGQVFNWHVIVAGTRERILDSVLPHEITHTILASHFAPIGKPVPRWADEGMCTTVEHASERAKHDHNLVQFLSHGKGIPFATLFLMDKYPPDQLTLYAQGYSLTSFLIEQRGPREFVRFMEIGMKSGDWVGATKSVYGYPIVGKLQSAWNQWVTDGGGDVASYTARSLGYVSAEGLVAASSNPKPADFAEEIAPATALVARTPPSTGYYADLLRSETAKQAANAPLLADRFQPAPTTEVSPSSTAQTRAAGQSPQWQTIGGPYVR
jgi:hypothetical protein